MLRGGGGSAEYGQRPYFYIFLSFGPFPYSSLDYQLFYLLTFVDGRGKINQKFIQTDTKLIGYMCLVITNHFTLLKNNIKKI